MVEPGVEMAIIPLPPWDLIEAGRRPRQRGRVHRRAGREARVA